ncbi:MAG: hypothetical protein QXK74_07410 [Candidatus Nitrosocaldaceae archaeon]
MSEFRISDLTFNDLVQLSLEDISKIIDELMQADAEVGQILQEVRSRWHEIEKDKREMYRIVVRTVDYIENYYDRAIRKLFVHWNVIEVFGVFDASFKYLLYKLKTAVGGNGQEDADIDNEQNNSNKENKQNKQNEENSDQKTDTEIINIINNTIYELRSTHEKNLGTLQYYFIESRSGWWNEPTPLAQLVSDAGKMLHDLAVIFTNIYDELEKGINPERKSLAHEIVEYLQSKSKYSDFVYFFAIQDYINIQARTSHSVKIDLRNKEVYGHFGDFSPAMFIETQFHFSNVDELYDFAELITLMIYYEQKIRNLITYLETNIDVLHEKQIREKVGDIELYWRRSKSTLKKLKEKYIDELHINYDEWYESLVETRLEPLLYKLKKLKLI